MNIKVPDSWLRDYIDTKAEPKDISKALSLHSFSVEKMENTSDGDVVYEIEVTPNRGDALSVLGIARELRAVLPKSGFEVKWIKETPVKIKENGENSVKVDIKDGSLVPRFSAVVLDVEKVKESPEIVQTRLEKVGIRSINAVVDVTNYLMIELGQPMHAFDFEKIQGATMILRESKEGEKVTTLDSVERGLPEGVIVIEDGAGRIIDLCGIMGGENSEIDEDTKQILLFVQIYDPKRIRRASMHLGHRTDAAVRFEKGIDFEGVIPALTSGVSMLEESLGAKVTSEVVDLVNTPEKTVEVELDKDRIRKIAGVEISDDEIVEVLTDLGFEIAGNKVTVPSFRHGDISIIEDLAEEVIRIYGYYNIPNNLPDGEIPQKPADPSFYWEEKVKDFLKFQGFFEAYTTSMTSEEMLSEDALRIANPLSSDLAGLKTSLVPQLLEVLRKNKTTSEDCLKFFELASVYHKKDGDLPEQPLTLALVASKVDYLEFKGYIEALYDELGVSDYSSIEIQVHENDVLSFEIEFSKLVEVATTAKTYTPISKFNSIKEDMTFVVPEDADFDEIKSAVLSADERVLAVDYKGVFESSLTLSVEYLDTKKQISSEDTAQIREKIFKSLDPTGVSLKQ